MSGMSLKQLRELQLFYSIEPFGEYRNELRHGQQMAFHHNLNRDPDKHPAYFKSIDFMNYIEEPPEKIYTVEELEEYANSIWGK